ncbi:MAG: hypothetical protein AAFV69_03260 [Pseudomonadota bacterium]
MKAFLMSIAVLAIVTVGAAMTLGTMEQSSTDTFKVKQSVRL